MVERPESPRIAGAYEDSHSKLKHGENLWKRAKEKYDLPEAPLSNTEIDHLTRALARDNRNHFRNRNVVPEGHELYMAPLPEYLPSRKLWDRNLEPREVNLPEGVPPYDLKGSPEALARRDAVFKSGPPPPRDIARPYLTEYGAKHFPIIARELANKYGQDLVALKDLIASTPTYERRAGESETQFAERIIKDRNQHTGEILTDKAIADEVKRIKNLNNNTIPESGTVNVYSPGDIKELARRAELWNTPPVGQFFLAAGLNQGQLDDVYIFQQWRYAKDVRPLFPDALMDYFDEKRKGGKQVPSVESLTKVDVDGKVKSLQALMAEERGKAGITP
jgi:hypothetical protein